MKNLLFKILVLVLLASCSSSPEAMNIKQLENRGGIYFNSDKNKTYSGLVFENSTSGSKAMEGELKQGLKTGTWVTYYDNGQKMSEGNYTTNLKDGEWAYWEANSNMKGKEFYKNGNLVGEPIDKKVEEEELEEEGSSETSKVNNNNSQHTTAAPSAPAMKTVEWSHLDGGFRKTYKGQDYTGYAIKRFKSGKIELRAEFLNSNRHGKWTYYYEDGTVKETKWH